jgi:hypothetical protein
MNTSAHPHTPGWFAVLEKQNPLQAEMVKATLTAVGRDDVCSVCGDDPAPICTLTNPEPETKSITMRLCGDCQGIRQRMFKEVWQAD